MGVTPFRTPPVGRSFVAVESLESRRLMAFADVDSSWGTNGVGVPVRVLSEQSDGKILAASSAGKTGSLVRLNADGSYDTTFSHDGRVPFSGGLVAARRVTGGNTVIAYTYSRRSPGQSNSVYTPDDDYVYGYGVARFTAHGVVDATFGDGGSTAAAFHTKRIGDPNLGGVAIDADGSVYFGVSGNYFSVLSSIDKFTSFVLKFNAQGQVDTTYGTNGIFTLPSVLLKNHRDFARIINSLELVDGGPLLIGGTELRFDVNAEGYREYQQDNAAASSFVTRLTRSGTDDTAFGTGGTFKIDKTIVSNGPDDGESAKVIRLNNGRVLLVTRISSRLRVITLNANGQIISSLSKQQDDTVGDNRAEIQFAESLSNGSLVVVRNGVIFEMRPTTSGYVAEAPKLPADRKGMLINVGSSYDNTLVPLRDGSILISLYNGAVKFSSGDGQTPREDDLPFARQNSITTPDVERKNDNYGIVPLDAFFHDERGGLKFRQRNDAGRWGAIETVDAAPNAGVYLSSIGGLVVYTDSDTGDLKAARHKKGKWIIETIDSRGSTGLYVSLVRTSADTFAVSYYDRTRGDLKVARRNAAGRWTIETVDSVGNVGRYAKLKVRPDGGLSVAYAINNTGGFRLADEKAGVPSGGWAFTDLATSGVDVDGMDMDYFLTNNDPEPGGPSELQTTVAIHDRTQGDLIVAFRPKAGAPFKLLREKSTGNVGQNPHVSHFGGGAVSFYDQTRNQVRTTQVIEKDGGVTLVTDPVPTVASAGLFANPVVSYEDPDIYNGYAGGGYTNIYAWADAGGVLKIRGPV